MQTRRAAEAMRAARCELQCATASVLCSDWHCNAALARVQRSVELFASASAIRQLLARGRKCHGLARRRKVIPHGRCHQHMHHSNMRHYAQQLAAAARTGASLFCMQEWVPGTIPRLPCGALPL